MKKNKYEIDMCNGTIMDKLISFALPLMVSGILQLMFNAVDIIVVGRFSGSQALAAVGSTTALINVFTNLFIGVSLGANVLAARFYAAGKDKEMSETVHTAITLALVSGVVMAVVGLVFSRWALEIMGTPADVIDQSTLYMRIYFLGMPFFMVYNYGASILRAVGDTKRPLMFLIVAGVINAVLNMFLVIAFHLGVAGVAIATVISQMISCILVLRCLYKTDSSYQLRFSKLCMKKFYLAQIFQVGIPAGIQSTVINISNALLQSSVNSFGSTAMAGYTAANNVLGFLYASVNAVTQACMSFTSQNYGVGKYKRMDRVLLDCGILSFIIAFVLGCGSYIFGGEILKIYTEDPEVIRCGESVYAGKPCEISGENRNFALRADGKLFLFVHDLGTVGDANVVAEGGGAGTKQFSGFARPVRAVRWVDNGESLAFEQDGGTLRVNCTGYEYGKNLVVRVAEVSEG